jgi:hypothetical protein
MLKNINVGNVQEEIGPLNVGDPNIGDSIWIDTDRFFYIGRYRGRSEDGQFWILDRASMVIQMGIVTKATTEGTSSLNEVHPFATPFYAVRYSTVTGWRVFPHELPSQPISRSS